MSEWDCQWCGVDLSKRRIPWDWWDNKRQCTSAIACYNRRKKAVSHEQKC